MNYIQPENRDQVSMMSLDAFIAADNEVRVIDAFVDALELDRIGFELDLAVEGRPPFHPSSFLKLYLYGYLNRIRSSRKLEIECNRNIELKWLLGNLVPNYHSIADFRKKYGREFKMVFKMFVLFLKEEKLLGNQIVAIDGSKFRAVNSSKNNYNEKKIKRHLEYIDRKANEYLTEMERLDKVENNGNQKLASKKEIKNKLKDLGKRRIEYKHLQELCNASDDGQVSKTDPDSKALIIKKNIVEVSYNTQTAVDEKNKLVVHYEATSKNDSKALSGIASVAKEISGAGKLTILADKGYHNGDQLQKCIQEGIITLVAFREQPTVKHLEREFLVENFHYNSENDFYTCPAGEKLKSNGNWYKKERTS